MLYRNAKIIATGMYAPERIVPNSWFDERLQENVSEWLETNLTIRERRWCAPDESTADLVVKAAEQILSRVNMLPDDLDLIIVATDTPEYVSPSTASVVQHRLKAIGAGTFDINTACAGFVTALDMGAKYIRSDERYKNVLVIGAYAMSKYLDLDDKKTVTLFADGAAGVILQADDSNTAQQTGWQSAQLYTEGQYADWMGIYGGGARTPITQDVVAAGDHKLRFVKKFPQEINPTTWTKMVQETVADAGAAVQDIDLIFFTQININSIRQTMGQLGLPMDKTHCVMDRYGYTGSACIPMCLAEADERGKLQAGNLVVMMGSGGGLAFACTAFRW